MGFRTRFRQAEQRIKKGVEKALGHDPALPLLESKIREDEGGRVFPFGKVTVLLQAPNQNLRTVLQTAFIERESLKADIIRKLEEAKVRYPDGLEIMIELRKYEDSVQMGSGPLQCFEMQFFKPDPIPKSEIPATSLIITKGSAEHPNYRIKKERILIGCLQEVLDREGRMVRKNDVVFPGHGGEINTTVDSVHARIWYEFEERQFRIMDEGSRYGTRIVREGRSLEVPSGRTRGLGLRSGDEIHCGQAGLRFEVISE